MLADSRLKQTELFTPQTKWMDRLTGQLLRPNDLRHYKATWFGTSQQRPRAQKAQRSDQLGWANKKVRL